MPMIGNMKLHRNVEKYKAMKATMNFVVCGLRPGVSRDWSTPKAIAQAMDGSTQAKIITVPFEAPRAKILGAGRRGSSVVS